MSYKSKPGYIDNLLILRGLCSYGVVLAHSLNMIPGFIIIDYLANNVIINEFYSNLIKLFWPSTGGNFVYIFFAHFGYLMGKIYWNSQYDLSRKSILNFYRNRFLRIAPLLYFNLLICIFFMDKFYLIFHSPLKVIGDFLFINNLTDRIINPVTWSLSFEMQDYLIAPLFFYFFSKKSYKNLMLTLLTMLVLIIYSYFSQLYPDYKFISLARFSWHFIGGYSVNIIVRYIHENGNIYGNKFTNILAFILFFLTNFLFYFFYNSGYNFIAQLQIQFFTMLCLLLLELPSKTIENSDYNNLTLGIIIGRCLTYIGIISYGVYLWHMPIMLVHYASNSKFISGILLVYNLFFTNYFSRIIFVNVIGLILISIMTFLFSLILFFLIELRFRPNLYNFNDSRIIIPLKNKLLLKLTGYLK